MTLPKRTAAYPAAMVHALEHAQRSGKLFIPSEHPLKLRMQFQGLRGALRLEGRGELADTLTFLVQKEPVPGLLLQAKDTLAIHLDIEKALTTAQLSQPLPDFPDDAVTASTAALNRILGLTP